MAYNSPPNSTNQFYDIMSKKNKNYNEDKTFTYIITHIKSPYFELHIVYRLFTLFNHQILVDKINRLDDILYNNLFDILFSFPSLGSCLFDMNYCTYWNISSCNNKEIENIIQLYKNQITKNNICKCIPYAHLLYDKINEYYKKNICTHEELFLIIERIQLKNLISIMAVNKTLSDIINSNINSNINSITFNILGKNIILDPFTAVHIENLEVLLNNKIKITQDIFQKLIDDMHIFNSNFNIKFITNKDYEYEGDYDEYNYYEHESEYNFIKSIIDKCLLAGGKLTYDIFKKLLKINVEYKDFDKYGIVLQDDIGELYTHKTIPEFIKKHGINITDDVLLKYFTENKNYNTINKYMTSNLISYNEKCLQGYVNRCRGNNYNTIIKLINQHKLKVSPNVIKEFITTTGQAKIGKLLWNELCNLYDFTPKIINNK
jgi:hypothetical protein